MTIPTSPETPCDPPSASESAATDAHDDSLRTLTDLIDDLGREAFTRALERRPVPRRIRNGELDHAV